MKIVSPANTIFVPGDLARGNRWAAIGDSITERSGNLSLGVISGLSWFSHAGWASGQRLRQCVNAGKSGDNTTQMLARLQTDVIAYNPTICAIFGGTNDVNQGGFSAVATMANITAMADMLRSANIQPVFCTIPPRTDGNYKTNIHALNTRITRYAEQHGYPLLDFYSQLTDPLVSGAWKTSYSLDGIHPQHVISRLMGQYASTNLAPLLPYWGPYLTLDPSDASNMLLNGTFATDTNADGVSDSYSVDTPGATLAFSRISDATYGYRQRITWTGSATSKGIYQTVSTGFSAGDRISIAGRFTSSLEANSAQVQFGLVATGATVDPKRARIDSLSTDVTNGLFYGELVVPTGTTGLQFLAVSSVASQTGTLDLAQVTMQNLTTMTAG